MEKLIKSIKTFMTDYKESMDRYGAAHLAVYDGLLAQNKDSNLLNNYIEYQHGSPANSPR